MKTAAIILMSFGLFVLMKDSQAADANEVFNELATKRHSNDQKVIPPNGLRDYLNKNGWTNPEGLTAEDAEDAILEWDGRTVFISKGKWDAMIRTATWLLSLEKHADVVWSELGDEEEIPTENLVEYMNETDWKQFSPDMTAEVAANHIACKDDYISKDEWNATIEIEACIRNAK